jgi:hypothetical protein
MPTRAERREAHKAFRQNIPLWQEMKAAGGGIQAIAYDRGNEAGKATYTRSTAKIRPSQSDFVCDTETNARRALQGHPHLLRYFVEFYHNYGQLDAVPPEFADYDVQVRDLVGQRFIDVELSPYAAYVCTKDVRRNVTRQPKA